MSSEDPTPSRIILTYDELRTRLEHIWCELTQRALEQPPVQWSEDLCDYIAVALNDSDIRLVDFTDHMAGLYAEFQPLGILRWITEHHRLEYQI